MFLFEKEAEIEQDREDLVGLLKLRFGSILPEVIQSIYKLKDREAVERLILVAANAPKLSVFLEELEEGSGNFKILGERFNPIESITSKGDNDEDDKK